MFCYRALVLIAFYCWLTEGVHGQCSWGSPSCTRWLMWILILTSLEEMRNTLFIIPREQQPVYGKFIFLLSSSCRFQILFFLGPISAKRSDTAVNSSLPLRSPFCPVTVLLLNGKWKTYSLKTHYNSKTWIIVSPTLLLLFFVLSLPQKIIYARTHHL